MNWAKEKGIKYLFKPRATVMYPEVKRPTMPRFHGHHRRSGRIGHGQQGATLQEQRKHQGKQRFHVQSIR